MKSPYCVWRCLCQWRCWTVWDGLRAAVILFKMSARPAWALCTVVQTAMVSFHPDRSDITCIDFLTSLKLLQTQRGFFLSSFIKDLHSCRRLAALWDDEDVSLQSNMFKRRRRQRAPLKMTHRELFWYWKWLENILKKWRYFVSWKGCYCKRLLWLMSVSLWW